MQFHIAKNKSIIIEDTYKATPLCTFWFLSIAQQIQAKRKILVLTEMRPLTYNVESFIKILGEMSKFADQCYFIGPDLYYNIILKINAKIEHIDQSNYTNTAIELIRKTTNNDVIFLKGANYYRLENLIKFVGLKFLISTRNTVLHSKMYE